MNTTWLAAVAVVLAACSGTTTGPSGEGGGRAGQASGGSAAGSGANAAGTESSGGTRAGNAGAGGAPKGGAGGNAGAALGGSAGAALSGSAGQSAAGAGASGGPPMIPDDAGSGACHDYTPCAGDVVGSWDIEICADPPLMGLQTFCPAATEALTMAGTADIRADGTMTSTLTMITDTNLPASCVAQLGTCGEPGGLNLLQDCTPGPAGSCLCSSMTGGEPSDATYTTTPEGLLTVVRDGQPNYSYYCRQGDEFWTRGVDADGGRITVLHFRKR